MIPRAQALAPADVASWPVTVLAGVDVDILQGALPSLWGPAFQTPLSQTQQNPQQHT